MLHGKVLIGLEAKTDPKPTATVGVKSEVKGIATQEASRTVDAVKVDSLEPEETNGTVYYDDDPMANWPKLTVSVDIKRMCSLVLLALTAALSSLTCLQIASSSACATSLPPTLSGKTSRSGASTKDPLRTPKVASCLHFLCVHDWHQML